MQFRGGMNELLRQAARLQRKVEETKQKLKDQEVTATAVGDKVKATVTLGRKVMRIEIDPEFLKAEGLELALDGACAAINAAVEQADKTLEAEVTKVTNGVKIPGVL